MSKTPKLRFKEFSGDWESKQLDEVTNYVDYRGKTPTKSENGVFLVTAKNIKKGYIDYSASQEFISNESYDEAMRRGLPKIGDVLLTTEAPLGNVAQIDREDIALAQRVIKFRGTDKLNNTYLKYYFLSERFQNKLFSKAIGTTVLGIQGKVLHKMPVIFPSKEEQEKIASFFSLIDDKISLQGEKVEALKDYKKGMMQKIFSRELRFKDNDGRDYPEWEITTMEKVADLEKGFTPDTKNEKNWIGNIPWLSIADMKQGKYLTDVSKYISDKALGNKQLVAEGTLIMSFKLTLGRLAIVNRPMITNEAICHFYWKYNNINTEYMYYYLSTVNIASFGCRAAKGITLNNDSLNSIVVKLPVINEQMKISNLLKNIDNKIEKEQEKLDSLNEYKKGLLQQMFV